MLDRDTLHRHLARNRRDTALVLLGLAGLTGLAGWLLAGVMGALAAPLLVVVVVAADPQASVAMLRAVYRARLLAPETAPELWSIHVELCRRAGLESVPPLFRIPSRGVMALSTGWGRHAAIALSDGALAAFAPGELVAVLAHEIAHIRAGDLKLLRLADAAGRLTHAVAAITLLLLALMLPSMAANGTGPNLGALTALVLAPIGCDLLRLWLSRTREFAADASAAQLCGSPDSLIAALARLEVGATSPRPLGWLRLIRTHPTTAERIDRLSDLAPPAPSGFHLLIPKLWRPKLWGVRWHR